MATNIFVHWSDGLGGRAFDNHSRNESGAFANKNLIACRAGHLTIFLKALEGGGVEGGGDAHGWN